MVHQQRGPSALIALLVEQRSQRHHPQLALLCHLQARRVGLLRPEHFSRRGIRSERQWVLPVALARHGDETIPVPLSLTAPAGFSPAAGPLIAPPGVYQERSPLGVLRSAPHEYYSESLVMAYGFGQ